MGIKLEKVALPDDGRAGTPKYPWRKIDVGESFFVPVSAKKVRTSLRNFRARKLSGPKGLTKPRGRFVIRDWEEDGVVGARVWRVE